MIVDLRSQSLEKISLKSAPGALFETAHSFSNRACILGKIGRRFNRQRGCPSIGKVDRLG
jgi:hypothetical protein